MERLEGEDTLRTTRACSSQRPPSIDSPSPARSTMVFWRPDSLRARGLGSSQASWFASAPRCRLPRDATPTTG